MVSNEQIGLSGLVIVAVVGMVLGYETIAAAAGGAIAMFIIPSLRGV